MNSSGETSWLNIFHLQRADPQTPWDLAFGVGVGSALTLLQLAVVAVSLLRYREPAIKFRQPLLMLCSILSNFAFFIGFCFSNDLIKQTSHATCTIFNIWFLMLGLTAWLSCNSARLAYLWTVFRSGGATSNGGMQTSNARRQDIKTVVVCAVLMIPMIIYCIIASIPQIHINSYHPVEELCLFSLHGAIITFVLLGLYLTVFMALTIATWRIRRHYSRAAGGAELAIFFVWTSLALVEFFVFLFRLFFLIPVRIITALIPVTGSLLYVLMLFGPPVLAILLRRDKKYFATWNERYSQHVSHILRKRWSAGNDRLVEALLDGENDAVPGSGEESSGIGIGIAGFRNHGSGSSFSTYYYTPQMQFITDDAVPLGSMPLDGPPAATAAAGPWREPAAGEEQQQQQQEQQSGQDDAT